jgi:hypothetical protein
LHTGKNETEGRKEGRKGKEGREEGRKEGNGREEETKKEKNRKKLRNGTNTTGMKTKENKCG